MPLALGQRLWRKSTTTIPQGSLNDNTAYHINPCSIFIIIGPMGDAGLTRLKIIIHTYCGLRAHGGGTFASKNTNVDSIPS